MSYACPCCATAMVRNKHDRRSYECLHCGAIGSSNVLHAQWASSRSMQRLEALVKAWEGEHDVAMSQDEAARMLRRALYHEGA